MGQRRGRENDNQGRETNYRGRENNTQGRETSSRGKESSKQGKESSYRGRENSNPGRESSYRGKENSNPGRENSNRGRENSNEVRESNTRGRENSNRNERTSYKRASAVEIAEPRDVDDDRLEGRNSVLEALRADRPINKLLIAKGDREGSIKQIAALAREKGILFQEVDRTFLDNMSSTGAHQGVIAMVSPKEYVEPEYILKAAQDKGEPPFIIILDGITDANNLGSILRTANAVGAHGVIIPKRRAIGLSSVVSKASAGAVEYVPVSRVTNIAQTIEYLKKNNVWIIGTDSSGEKSFYKSNLKGPIALVIGSEGEGIGKLIKEKCDFIVNIPMKGEISSLNAAVAGAIVMYEILKQRDK